VNKEVEASQMKTSLAALCALFLALILSSGCDLGVISGTDTQIDVSANGKTFAFAVDQPFSMELEVLADAGFRWYLTFSDPTIIKLSDTKYRPKNGDTNVCGGMTIQTFYFQPLKHGNCTVTLEERQGWMPNDPPRNTVQFKVIVRQ
jgi:predicted secreted protein